MSRSLVLLIVGVYGLLLAGTMLLVPEWLLRSYGNTQIDASHVSLMRYLGVSDVGLALLALMNRNAASSAVLLASAIVVLGGIGVGLVDITLKGVPFSGFFLADTALRLLLGGVLLVCYNRERRQVTSHPAN